MGTTRLLSICAATMLLGASAASAGPINGPVKPERAPAAQQNAPAEKIAPPMHPNAHTPAETTGQGTPNEFTPEKLKPGSGGNTTLSRDGTTAHQPGKKKAPSESGSANELPAR